MHEPRPDDELESEVSALRASSRRGLRRGLVSAVSLSLLIGAWTSVSEDVRRFVRGEVSLDGEPQYTPSEVPDPVALEQIDFERVHREAIPRWTVALSRATSPYWERRADEVFDDLRAEVSPDPNLEGLLTRTHRALRDHDPLEHAERMDYWLWAYNRYLEEQHVPWRLEATLRLGEDRPVLFTRSYEILADQRNAEGHRVRLLRRADSMSNLEGWMGRTGSHGEGAMVLMRRVLHFTVRHVWPALRPALEARRPLRERSWLAPARAEVAAQLSPDAFEILSETAEDQQALIEVAAMVETRAEACGGLLRFHGLPYNGLSPRSIDAIQGALVRSQRRPDCPEITIGEAAMIVGASERLAETPGIETALEELTMVVARAVAVHELQHVVDGDDVECPGCPEELTGLALAEVSAYLSAFSTEGVGYLSLLQACASVEGEGGVHGSARAAVLDALLPYGCEGPPLIALYHDARYIEGQLFGARAHGSLPELPHRVRLLPRTQRMASSGPAAVPLETGWGVRIQRSASYEAASP